MILYAHRGNMHGPKPELENNPHYVDLALKAGFFAEIDLRYEQNSFYLGHDSSQNKIDFYWLYSRRDCILVHIKTMECFAKLPPRDCHYFCHKNDPFVFTSLGFIWLHDRSTLATPKCIVPLITDSEAAEAGRFTHVYGICSDWVGTVPH